MTLAVLDIGAKEDALTAQPLPALRLVVLARLAGEDGASRAELQRELGPLLLAGAAKTAIDTELVALVHAALATENRARFKASALGASRLAAELGCRSLPKSSAEIRDVRLVAKALGLEGEAQARVKALAEPDRLRAEMLGLAFGFRLRGVPSAPRLRSELALVALEQAFGNRIKSGIGSRAAFNAKTSRVLAGQLLAKPRDPGTDSRLVAQLAADVAGSAKVDADAVRLALLRRLVAGQRAVQAPAAPVVVPPAPSAATRAANQAALPPAPAPAVPSPLPARPAAASRPGLEGFVAVVQAAGRAHAEGWPGNRKALVSRVWQAVEAAHPDWGLSAIEFKAMLAEAHRTGHLALATADLKDKGRIRELQESAITYKNTVWHLVRVED